MPEDKKETKPKDDFKKSLQKGFDNLAGLIKKAKDKYDKADPKTKKTVLAGVAGAAAFLAGALSAHNCCKKKKDK